MNIFRLLNEMRQGGLRVWKRAGGRGEGVRESMHHTGEPRRCECCKCKYKAGTVGKASCKR